MITLITTTMMLQVVRNSCKKRGMTDEEVDELEATITLKMVAWALGIMLLVSLAWLFTDPQFCFRRDIINFVKYLGL
jgi:hypothetical protein